MLPKGWTQSPLRESIRIHSGYAPSDLVLLTEGEIPYVKVEDLNNCEKYQTDSREYLSVCRSVVPAQSLIFPKRGAAIFANKIRIAARPLALDTNLMGVEIVSGLDPEYLYYAISFAGLHRLADTSTIPQLNNKHVLPHVLPRPSMKEQCRIAQILSTWDQAIATAELLLLNSKEQRLLISQQMLTGKVRIKDFLASGRKQKTPYGSLPIEWGYRRIGDLAVEVSQKLGGVEPYPVLSCTKHKGLVDSLAYFNKQVFSADTSTYKVVPRGCFVYATNHIDEGSIGYQNLYDFGLVSPMYTVFKANDEVDDAYLFALLKTEQYRQIFASATNASVDRRGSLRWKDFRNLHIPLPPIEEQRAIAKVLASAVREAELIQAQLGLLRDEKAALMSQLLTGKRRVKLPDVKTEEQA